jgi:hypothetical protein
MVEARDPSLAPSRPGLLFDPPHADRGPLNLTALSAPSRTCSANLGIGRVAAAAAAARGAYLILAVAHRVLEEGTAVSWAFLLCPSFRPRSATRGRPQILWRVWMEAREWCLVWRAHKCCSPSIFPRHPPKKCTSLPPRARLRLPRLRPRTSLSSAAALRALPPRGRPRELRPGVVAGALADKGHSLTFPPPLHPPLPLPARPRAGSRPA